MTEHKKYDIMVSGLGGTLISLHRTNGQAEAARVLVYYKKTYPQEHFTVQCQLSPKDSVLWASNARIGKVLGEEELILDNGAGSP